MSNILNFKDWFKVYESAGFKYRPGMAIFEDTDPVEPVAGTPLNSGGNITLKSASLWLDFTKAGMDSGTLKKLWSNNSTLQSIDTFMSQFSKFNRPASEWGKGWGDKWLNNDPEEAAERGESDSQNRRCTIQYTGSQGMFVEGDSSPASIDSTVGANKLLTSLFKGLWFTNKSAIDKNEASKKRKEKTTFSKFISKYSTDPAADSNFRSLNFKISEAIEVPVNYYNYFLQFVDIMGFGYTYKIGDMDPNSNNYNPKAIISYQERETKWTFENNFAGSTGACPKLPINIYVPTLGTITGKNQVANGSTQYKTVDQQTLVSYLNSFNLMNFSNGSFQQYDIQMNSDGYIDLMGNVVEVKDKVILYSTGENGKETITREETAGETKTVGAQSGGSGDVSIGYPVNKYNVDTNNKPIDAKHPEVQRVVGEILAAIGDSTDVKVDTLTLTSSASTAWQGQTMTESNGTGDPSKGSLNEKTFLTNKTALGNQYLAWLRGKTFLDALKSALGELAADAPVINWKVSNEGPAGGKNISFEWTKKKNPGKTYSKPGGIKYSSTVSQKPKGPQNGYMYKYEITWNNEAIVPKSKEEATTPPTPPSE